MNRAHIHDTMQESPISFKDTYDVNAVSATPDFNVIATGGDEGLIKLWDRRMISSHSKPIGGFIGHFEGITSLDTSCNCS